MRVSKSVMGVCGVVVAAAAIGFTDPKAVHAVTAALVQVTNTAANPVVTQGVGQQAANMVELNCLVQSASVEGSGPCFAYGADAATPYSVPSGKSLVVTAIDARPGFFNPCSGYYEFRLDAYPQPTGYLDFVDLWTSNSPVGTHVTYPSGLVIPQGQVILVGVSEYSNGGYPSNCHISESMKVYGYLMPA